MKDELIEGEEKMLYQLGALGQLWDDLFDLHDDYLEGVHTYALNNSHKIQDVIDSFNHEVKKLKHLLFELPLPENRKRLFWREFHLLLAGGILCAKQYENLLGKYGKFDLKELQREEVVCDMEDKRNWLKMMYISIRYA